MMRGKKGRGLLIAAVMFAVVMDARPAAAVSLEDAYLAALRYDADLLAAGATRDEAGEGVAVARAALLPQLSYSSQNNTSDTYTNYVNPRFRDYGSGTYTSKAASVTLRQALFRKPAWDALQAAKGQAGAAEADYLKEVQNSALRAIASYLEVLAQRTTLTLAHKQTEAIQALQGMAERMFEAGHGTRTDIADARSRHDISRANETEANLNLAAAARSFEVVTGLDSDNIPDINPRQLDPDRLLVDHQEQWLARIEDENLELRSLRQQLEAAQSVVAQMRGGHLPTVDLVAGKSSSLNETNTSLSTPAQYTTNYVGVQVNIPLFAGGGVMAQTDQALARAEKVRQILESTRRKAQAEGRRLFFLVRQGDELVKAQSEAVRSAEQAVEAQKKGIQAGTRTFVDLLDAERRLYEALRDHTIAIYTLVSNRFKLQGLAGAIDIDSVKMVSNWLSTPAP